MNVGRIASFLALACLAPTVLAADTSTSDHFTYLGCGPYPGAHTASRLGAGFRIAPSITLVTPLCRPGPQNYCRWIVYASPWGKCLAATLHSGANWRTGFDVREFAAGGRRVIRSSVIHVKDPASGKPKHLRRVGPGVFSTTS
jgi:hypothetical protein